MVLEIFLPRDFVILAVGHLYMVTKGTKMYKNVQKCTFINIYIFAFIYHLLAPGIKTGLFYSFVSLNEVIYH